MLRCTPLRNPQKIRNIARSLRTLCDRASDTLKPSVFTAAGFHPGPRYVNAYLIIFDGFQGSWRIAAREAAAALEKRHGLLLDWAAGFRKSGRVWLIIKTLAKDAKSLKARRFRPAVEDLQLLRCKFSSKGGRNR